MPHRITNTKNIIGENSVFEGVIKFQGDLRIDGTYYGNELDMDHIIVGKTGQIKADIKTNAIVVEGTILGNIFATFRTILLPTARILGDISSPEIIIQNGVLWDGHCHTGNESKSTIANLVKKSFE